MSESASGTAIEITTQPVVAVQMLIRRPVAEVFDAFVDPAHTTAFWFTRSSGPLSRGVRVRWDWEMYGASAEVTVLELETDHRLLVEWDEPPTQVEWSFDHRPDGSTMVRITNSGFSGSGDEMVAKALDATSGFSLLLAAAKAYLEHGVRLNLVADHAPEAHLPGWGS